MNNSATGLKLRARREALGASQTEIADLLGISDRSRISAWENGRNALPVGVDADLFAFETLYEHIVGIAVDAITEAHTNQPGKAWLISSTALAMAADRLGITTPQGVRENLATRVHSACQKAGINTVVTHT